DVGAEGRELIGAGDGPRRLVVPRIDRPLLAVGNGFDATRIDPVVDEIRPRRDGAPVAERQVVFVRAALVTVAGDPDPNARVAPQDGNLLIQSLRLLRADVRLVEVEVDYRGEDRLDLVRRPPPLGRGLGLLPGPRHGILAGRLRYGVQVRCRLRSHLRRRGVVTGDRDQNEGPRNGQQR